MSKKNQILNIQDAIKPIAGEMKSFEKLYHKELKSDSAFIQPLLDSISRKKGKRLRPILFMLSQGVLGKPQIETMNIAVLLELLHVATLIHDDVVDESPLRRGLPTLNAQKGNQIPVLLGDYLFAKVLALGVQSPHRQALEIVSRVVMDMGKGELRQAIAGKDRILTEKEYFKVIQEKTAGLFIASCELAGIVQAGSEDQINLLKQFGQSFGILFQIRDDILDFTGTSESLGKPTKQDISSGKSTLPLILSITGASRKVKKSVFDKLQSATDEDNQWLIQFISEKDGVRKAQERAVHYAEQAGDSLLNFGSSPYRDALLALVKHDLERSY